MRNFFDSNVKNAGLFAIFALIFFLLMAGINSIVDARVKIKSANATNTITFHAMAEVKAVPDIATFQITVREEEKTIELAQQKMSEKTAKLINLLQDKSVEKYDIQTTNYSTNPKYEYQVGPCKKGVCPQGKQVLVGYGASETLFVKLRDLKKTQEILSAISALQIIEVNGPNLAIENPEKFKIQAQAEAISKAKAEAKTTAKNLGVKLTKIIRFSEDPTPPRFPPHPMLMTKASSDVHGMLVPAPLEGGEDKIISNVFVTYEIE
jgi:uncharacterized protein YggE